eukprot:TRINITY_DN7835_c0_g1_i4.p1 TRINITY_DN7835_c0_g1~~TRINITY_DN7835_c0_g1_i4.p1  ORF type:complete len:169 (-),score=63.02 TRINITY_DN7835_c0_g1_i4:233-739(-)
MEDTGLGGLAEQMLCNGSTMTRIKVAAPPEEAAADDEDEWVYDFYEVDEEACSSGDLENAEVLTIAYFDENGELVCEDAVDSDDDFGSEEDADAQEWDYPDEDEASDEEVEEGDEEGKWWIDGGEGGALSSDDDDQEVYRMSMYGDKEKYGEYASDSGSGEDDKLDDY